jgi:all-trans-retinol 13,14-reductase
MTMASYIQSAWRMREGGHRLVQRLVKAIQQAGGSCVNYAEVEKVTPTHTGQYVITDKQGRTFETYKVLYATHPFQVIKTLAPEILPRQIRRKSALPESAAGITFHLALKPGKENYKNYNVYGHPTGQVWDGAFHDPLDHWAIYWYPDPKLEGKASVISILTYCPAGYFDKWTNTFRSHPRFKQARGEDYEALKMALAERLLFSLPEPVQIIQDNIDSITVSTALTWRDYIGSPSGSMYGILKDFRRPLASLFSPVLIPDRIYFTGQNLNLHGVTGTSLSALITCGSIVGLPYLLEKIRKET